MQGAVAAGQAGPVICTVAVWVLVFVTWVWEMFSHVMVQLCLRSSVKLKNGVPTEKDSSRPNVDV